MKLSREWLHQKYVDDGLSAAMSYEEFWDIDNGRTLCVDCYKKTDTWRHKAHSFQ